LSTIIYQLLLQYGDNFWYPTLKGVNEIRHKTSFFDKVYAIVARIPYGRVISYGQIARMLGNPRGARTVGWALSACPDGLPWQRVVKADGYIAGGEFAELRRSMLLEEGIPFLTEWRVDMPACEWDGGFV